jgi:hypothetical protein
MPGQIGKAVTRWQVLFQLRGKAKTAPGSVRVNHPNTRTGNRTGNIFAIYINNILIYNAIYIKIFRQYEKESLWESQKTSV